MGANFNFNKVIIGGRLTANPESRQTQSGTSVASFTVAVNRRYSKGQQPETDFLNVTAWAQTADFVARYFQRGSSICVVGTIQNRSWTDSNNQKQYRTDIIADEVMFVDSKAENGAQAEIAPTMTEINTNDDDLPF